MKKLALFVLFVSVSLHALMAQSVAQSVTSLLPGGAHAQAATPAPADELGRGTPSGAVFGFLQAAQAGNYKTAADYLQMSTARRQSQGADLAEKLKVLMDRTFVAACDGSAPVPKAVQIMVSSTCKPSEFFPMAMRMSRCPGQDRGSEFRKNMALLFRDAHQGSRVV